LSGDDDIGIPCPKILDFGFAGTYDSYSCYNFAKGDVYGNASLAGDVLCLNGVDQFLTVNKPLNCEAISTMFNVPKLLVMMI
jgi:hypothetical protein